MVDRDLLLSYLRKQITTAEDRLQSYIVDDKGNKLRERFILTRIKKLLNDYLDDRNTENRWITIPGFRGTGKTTLLAQIYSTLINKGISRNRILYLSLDEVTKLLQSNLYEMINLYEAILGKSIESINEKTFLLIDEASYDKNWDITLKTIFDRTKNIFTIVTGSSSLLLQTTADSARRKHVEKLFPLTFIEYILLKEQIYPIRDLKTKIIDGLFSSKTAEEVYSTLDKLRGDVNRYWSNIKPYEFEEYLTRGTLPFTIHLDKDHDIYDRLIEILQRVIYEDIPLVDNYDKTTLDKIWNLLLLLSEADSISLESLSKKINLEKPTVYKILNTLVKAELIIPVKSYGTASKQATKSPKYPFSAPIIKASLLWTAGRLIPDPDTYGRLLQDLVALYLYKMSYVKPYFKILYDSSKGGADFIIKDTRDNTNIIIEVGYGQKDSGQIDKTMKKIPAKYGLIISKRELSIKDNKVFIPHSFFFLT